MVKMVVVWLQPGGNTGVGFLLEKKTDEMRSDEDCKTAPCPCPALPRICLRGKKGACTITCL